MTNSGTRDIARATDICHEAGRLAMDFFQNRNALSIESKGPQDWVTKADREVERLIRDMLAAAWPDDAVVGEEHANAAGSSGFTWVIDPIDGTANFVNGIPVWCVVLAGVSEGKTRIGIIYDPNHDETFVAVRGAGASLNGNPMHVAEGVALNAGTVAIGLSNRIDRRTFPPMIGSILDHGAKFVRNASGAISLAYVASGRFVGYLEQYMNAWDCLAGQLMIEEAGGTVEDQDAGDMIVHGGRVIAGPPQVFPELKSIAEQHWA